MGLKPTAETTPPKLARLRKRRQKIEALPAADQRAVLKRIDALHETRQRTQPPRARHTHATRGELSPLASGKEKSPAMVAGLFLVSIGNHKKLGFKIQAALEWTPIAPLAT